ncbi:MAG: hypothetical protein QOG33_235 [Gaiellales bacterium]|jgi:hypothetical protein|nr:hypothetical protein [Gaiellales bacterium]
MTSPLVWLLLSALALISPPQGTSGPAPWNGRQPVILWQPSQPSSGQQMVVTVAGLPARAQRVRVVAGDQVLTTRMLSSGDRRALLVAPEPGPLTLLVRFTLRGHRYQAQGGVVLVVPAR